MFNLRSVWAQTNHGETNAKGSANTADGNGCPGVSERKAKFNLLPLINCLCCALILWDVRRALEWITAFCYAGTDYCPLWSGDTFHNKKSFTGHSPEKRKNQFMPMQDFLLSLVAPTTAHPPPQACSCIACLTLERDITSLGYFPRAFVFQPTTGRVHKVSISRKMFLFPTLGFSPKTAN